MYTTLIITLIYFILKRYVYRTKGRGSDGFRLLFSRWRLVSVIIHYTNI